MGRRALPSFEVASPPGGSAYGTSFQHARMGAYGRWKQLGLLWFQQRQQLRGRDHFLPRTHHRPRRHEYRNFAVVIADYPMQRGSFRLVCRGLRASSHRSFHKTLQSSGRHDRVQQIPRVDRPIPVGLQIGEGASWILIRDRHSIFGSPSTQCVADSNCTPFANCQFVSPRSE